MRFISLLGLYNTAHVRRQADCSALRHMFRAARLWHSGAPQPKPEQASCSETGRLNDLQKPLKPKNQADKIGKHTSWRQYFSLVVEEKGYRCSL